MRRRVVFLTVICAAVCARADAAPPSGRLEAGYRQQVDVLEKAVAAEPENLRVAADYRQLIVAGGQFDRSIDTLERLAERRGSGPNIQISLALAYVDKVPTSGEIRRLYLGRDAMNALTRSIAIRPSVLAYYIRGVINLFYNNRIFHRAPNGIADLQKALSMVTGETPPALVARVYVSLGDGFWRTGQPGKARDAWSAGAERVPGFPALTVRLSSDEREVAAAVKAALKPGNRIDTSLQGVRGSGP